MIDTLPKASREAMRRAGALVIVGVLLLAAGWLIACWGVAGLPLGLISLAAAAAALLWPEVARPDDEAAACRETSLQHFTQASLLTLVILHLAA